MDDSPPIDEGLRGATIHVLREQGWDGLTLERVADVSGRARSTLWRQGITRERLVGSLVAEVAGDFRETMFPILTSEGSGADRLRRSLEALCELIDRHLPLLLATDDVAVATAWDVVQRLRKRGVLVADAPAFVVNRVLTRLTTVLMDGVEHGNTVEETDEAVLRLGLPMAPSVLLQLVGPRVANHVLHTLNAAYPERYPTFATLDNYAEGSDEVVVREHAPRSVDELHEAALEALADEIRRLVDEGVVAEPEDVDTCLLLGAGWPFWLGGITPHLDATGVSERVTGRRFH